MAEEEGLTAQQGSSASTARSRALLFCRAR